MLGAGTDANVLGEIFPADDAGTVDKKFSGARDVVLFRAAALMQEIVAANDFGLRIAEKREVVALLQTKMLRDFGRVDADGDGANALRCKLRETVRNAS